MEEVKFVILYIIGNVKVLSFDINRNYLVGL